MPTFSRVEFSSCASGCRRARCPGGFAVAGKVDHPLLHYASHALYGSFLDAGIEIHEYHKSLMHAKVAVIDEHWATVGSSNLDPFSLLLALEANVVVDDEGFAKELKHSLEQAIKTGAQRIVKNWRTQSFRLRLASWLSYGVVRFMIGIAGMPREKTGRASRSKRRLNDRCVSGCMLNMDMRMKTYQDIKSAATSMPSSTMLKRCLVFVSRKLKKSVQRPMPIPRRHQRQFHGVCQ
jgi:hypothetical protein